MKKAIGIDLGTTNSVFAFKDASIKVLRNKEGKSTTRSAVAIDKGSIVAGNNALKVMKRKPQNTLLSIKRLMGMAFNSEDVQKMKASDYYSYAITQYQGGTENAVAVVVDGQQYTPEEISAEILKKIKSDAEAELNDEVSHAVITVPAYFTEKQKNATRVALN